MVKAQQQPIQYGKNKYKKKINSLQQHHSQPNLVLEQGESRAMNSAKCSRERKKKYIELLQKNIKEIEDETRRVRGRIFELSQKMHSQLQIHEPQVPDQQVLLLRAQGSRNLPREPGVLHPQTGLGRPLQNKDVRRCLEQAGGDREGTPALPVVFKRRPLAPTNAHLQVHGQRQGRPDPDQAHSVEADRAEEGVRLDRGQDRENPKLGDEGAGSDAEIDVRPDRGRDPPLPGRGAGPGLGLGGEEGGKPAGGKLPAFGSEARRTRRVSGIILVTDYYNDHPVTWPARGSGSS